MNMICELILFFSLLNIFFVNYFSPNEQDERSYSGKRSVAKFNNNTKSIHHRPVVCSTVTNNIISSTSTRDKERTFTTCK